MFGDYTQAPMPRTKLIHELPVPSARNYPFVRHRALSPRLHPDPEYASAYRASDLYRQRSRSFIVLALGTDEGSLV